MTDPMLQFRKPKCIVVDNTKSWSGKYWGFYGHHYVGGHICFDVGARNEETGEITIRHYSTNSTVAGDPAHRKAEALVFWQEFKEALQRPPEGGEEKDFNEIPLTPWLQ